MAAGLDQLATREARSHRGDEDWRKGEEGGEEEEGEEGEKEEGGEKEEREEKKEGGRERGVGTKAGKEEVERPAVALRLGNVFVTARLDGDDLVAVDALPDEYPLFDVLGHCHASTPGNQAWRLTTGSLRRILVA